MIIVEHALLICPLGDRVGKDERTREKGKTRINEE
jgi:hypothetical protein